MKAILRASLVLAALAVLAGLPSTYAGSSVWRPTETRAFPLRSSIAHSPAPANMPVHVMVGLKLRDEQGLNAFLRAQHTPGNPQYGVTLTPAQFTASYSPTLAQAQAVASYLTASGFTNVAIKPSRLLVTADGTAAVAQHAFHTSLMQFQYEGKRYYAPSADVMVPAALGGTVRGVFGLRNVPWMKTSTKALQPLVAQDAQTDAGSPALSQSFSATQLNRAYDVAGTPAGTGTIIAVSSAGTDLSHVVAALKHVEDKNQDRAHTPILIWQSPSFNPAPGTTGNGDFEWGLDSQAATGIAGGAQQLVFYNTADLGDSLLEGYEAFANPPSGYPQPKAGNMSYGGCEILQHDLLGTGILGGDFVGQADDLFAQAQAQGQTWFASSGDAGAACSLVLNMVTPDLGVPSQVEYPASSPHVVAVGGTSLIADADGNRIDELGWDAGGGGTSILEIAPDWQANDAAVPTAFVLVGGRAVPDIAMIAGGPDVGSPLGWFGFGGYDIYMDGDNAAVGTSLSSPLAMGVLARLQSAHCNKIDFLAPHLYALDATQIPGSTATGFNDILVGNNGQWSNTPGWDYVTGYGTFDVSAVNAALTSLLGYAGADESATCVAATVNHAPTAQLTATPTSGNPPLTVAFKVTATDADAGDAVTAQLDFGDGTQVPVVDGQVLSHEYTSTGTYTAVLTVTDSHGATGAASTPISINAPGSGSGAACTSGGALVFSDATGDELFGSGASAQADIQSLHIGEPSTDSHLLTIVLKVGNLAAPLQPNTEWKVSFNVTDTTGKAQTLFVEMDTNDQTNSGPQFGYGYTDSTTTPGQSTDINQANAGVVTGTYNADGTITFKLRTGPTPVAFKALATGGNVFTAVIDAGTVLSSLSADTLVMIGAEVQGSGGGELLQADAAGGDGTYTVQGNAFCLSNNAPVASLAVSSTDVLVGDAVTFDASGSSDPDNDAIVSYVFHYGDGASDTVLPPAKTASHSYTVAGSYGASVTVTDARGKSTTSPVTAVTVSSPVAPTPSVTLAQDDSNRDLANGPVDVVFTATAANFPSGDTLSYTFSFGDGSTASVTATTETTVTASHAYTAVGSYPAHATVTDASNVIQSSDVTVKVIETIGVGTSSPPSVVLTLQIPAGSDGTPPLDVTFDGSQSQGEQGATLTGWTLDFGDGSPVASGSGVPGTVQHSYTQEGNYTAVLTVTDSRDNTGSAVATIQVAHAPGAIPELTYPVNVLTGDRVRFDGSASIPSRGATITSYTFDFGDGTPAVTTTNPVVMHVYRKAGAYTPSLEVTDSAGSSNVTPKSMAPITVSARHAQPAASGGGALGWLTLLPLGLAGLRRRHR